MSIKHQLLFWGTTLCLFLGFILIFKEILLPFVLGIALAYLLNPLIIKLTKSGVHRSVSSILIISLFFIVFALGLLLLTPVLLREATDFIQNVPAYMQHLTDWIKTQMVAVQPFIGKLTGSNEPLDVRAILNGHSEQGIDVLKRIAGGLGTGGRAVFDVISIFFLTPVVAFFMIKEWPGITQKIEHLMPHDHRNTIHKLWDQIDTKLSGFVRGQITVALVLGLSYALALSVAGLKYGALVGLLSGALSIIPLFGSIVGLLASLIIAWFQEGEIVYVALIGAIFLIGQVIEGNVLTPKLVGESVGLHPLWVFFALMAGGSLFGILGMLLAVPVAAVIAVLLGFAIEQYTDSAFYKPTPKITKKRKA